MSRSNDPGHYFQTTEALETTARKAAKSKNTHGDPIKLTSKILAAVPDPHHPNAVYVAEAVGEIRRVQLDTGKTVKIFDQSAAPLTCLTVCPHTQTLYTGSWDKTIYAISLTDRAAPVRQLHGHTDFLKCLLTTTLADGAPILISGAADATLIIWDLSPPNFGHPLHKLHGHTKALADLALDPETFPAAGAAADDPITLFSASSDREIRQWTITRAAAHELPTSLASPLRPHETSIYRLTWDSDGDLWTASADKTAQHLVRARDWAADTVLPHPDFVRDVAVFEARGLVVTACRDEHVRVWEATSGALLCTYEGHFEEVTALVAVSDAMVVSVSIDGTLRRWSLDRAAMARYREELAREGGGEQEGEKAAPVAGVLTAEEEAELAELMDDNDDDD